MLRELPESITEMRLRVVPRSDGGADVLAEGDTKDAEAATSAAEDVARFARRHNDTLTSLLTHGLFDRVEVSTQGRLVKAHVSATLDQISTVVALVGDLLGVGPPGKRSVSPHPLGPDPRLR
jgi:FAD/FMN-containing dehydrogenase